ncbi:transcriptional regulator [Bradyrhizobium embrapense]
MPAGSWSAEEEQELLQLIRETGLTQREIAHKLGRTEAAVSCRLAIIRKRIAEKASELTSPPCGSPS